MAGSRKSAVGCITIVVIVVILYIVGRSIIPKSGAAATSGMEEPDQKTTYAIEGRDPCAFKDAEEMFRTGNAKKITEADAEKLVTDLLGRLKEGKTPEDPACRQLLIRLETAPGLQGIRRRLQEALGPAAKAIGKPLDGIPADAGNAFTAANGLYKKKQFDQCVSAYRAILAKYPGIMDARNNLGLAEIHLGHNLAALIQFDAILLVDKEYGGARVNATAALTRLGLGDQAYGMASEAAAKNPQSVMARFNMGWQQNARGEFDAAASSFTRALLLYPDYSKAGLAKALNTIENLRKPAQEELAGLTGAERASLLAASVSIVTINTPSDAGVLEKVKGFFMTDRRLLSEKKGDRLAVYRVQDGKKALVWLDEKASAAATVAAYDPKAKVGAFDRALPFPGKAPFWWPFLAAALVVHVLFTRRAFKGHNRGVGAWGVVSIVLLAGLGVLYPFVFPAAVGLGWTLIAASVVNATVLHARGKN
jgi:tetratricopeptide (TPR) repeat protein